MTGLKRAYRLDDADDDEKEPTSPEAADEASASGTAPDVESDDDVDEIGAAVGIHYEPDEELDISKKIS
jgi:hypothetical protein